MLQFHLVSRNKIEFYPKNIITQTHPRRIDEVYTEHLNQREKPLLHRLCFCFPEFLLAIVQNHFQIMLVLRAVSKDLKSFVSNEHTSYPYIPLIDQTTVSFEYEKLFPITEGEIQKKWDFVTSSPKMELQFITQIINFDIHYQEKLDFETEFENDFKLVFKIENNTQLNKLEELSSDILSLKALNLLKKVDFSELFIDAANITSLNNILTAIDKNLAKLPHLTSILIGKVCTSVSLQIPQEIDRKFVTFKIEEEKDLLSAKNVIMGAAIGFSAYSLYRYWFTKDPENKKDKKS